MKLLAFILIFAMMAFLGQVVEAGGFGNSCARSWLANGFDENLSLHAICLNNRGFYTRYIGEVDLNKCLVNNDGWLAFQPYGGFRGGNSCRDCRLDGTHMTCTCAQKDGNWRTNTINLNDGIKNSNSRLLCDWDQ